MSQLIHFEEIYEHYVK